MLRQQIRRKLFLSVKGAELVFRRLSAFGRALPSIFILGATKSGSTSLTMLLWNHPAHQEAFAKELMYLQKLPEFDSAWEWHPIVAFLWGQVKNGHARYCLGGYRKFFPLKMSMMLREARVGHAVTSECDPFNIYCPTAMERIQSFARDPRFIVSLRHPIDRAYSDYNMHSTRIGDERRSFEQCIEDELSGQETRFRKRYLGQSIYEPHLRRWIDAFGRERFLIVKAEDFFRNPAQIASQMFAFLGLPEVPVDTSPGNVGRYASDLEEATQHRLREYFRPHNQKLQELLGWGHDLGSGWLEGRPKLDSTWRS